MDGASSVDSIISSEDDCDSEHTANCEDKGLVKKDPVLAGKETRRVVYLRCLVIFCLFAAVAVASVLTRVLLINSHGTSNEEAVS
jgi:hypothetical protein